MDLIFTPSSERRLIVIGDVHGCLEELRSLLEEVKFSPGNDHLLFLGDIVDRGPLVNDTVTYVKSLCDRGFAICLLGNHEEKHIRFDRHTWETLRSGKPNPMRFDKQRSHEHAVMSLQERAWLSTLPLFVKFTDGGRRWIASHAGIPCDKPMEEQDPKKLVRTRYLDEQTGAYATSKDPDVVPEGAVYWARRWRGPESVVYGHIVHDLPMWEGLTFGIDTGCCFGGRLTAAIFDGSGGHTPGHHMVEAKRSYFSRRKGMDAD